MKQKKCLQLAVVLILAVVSCNSDKNFNTRNLESKNVQALLEKGNNKYYSPKERIKFIDSAYRIQSSKVIDSLLLAVIYAKSNGHFNLKQHDSTFYYDNQLRVKAEKVSDYYFLGKAHANLAFHFRKKETYDSAYYHFNQSKQFFNNLGDSIQVGRKLIGMGIIQQSKSDFFGSKETLAQALAFLEPKKDLRYVASAYNEIGKANRKLLNYSDAISYYKKAIDLTTSKKAKSTFKNNLATVLIDDKQYLSAESLLQTLIDDSVLVNIPSNYARVIDNLAYARWHNGKADIVKQLLKGLQIRKKENDKRGQIASYTHLGEYFLKTDSKKADRYLDTVIQISKLLKIPKAEQDALKFLMDLQPNNTEIRNRYIFLQDSLYKVGLKVKTQFAEMKYDDEQKQLSILKLEAEKERKNAELAEQQAQKTLLLSLSGLLLLGGISAFYILRQRHKKEKLQEVYTTEKRLSKKVHDELANDIYGVMTRMEHSKTLRKEDTLDALEDIYKRTRDISHETGTVDTQNFPDELKRLLSQFRNDEITIAVKGLSTIKWESIADEKKITLYRVMNELLVNMKKHSGATLVSISFEQQKKQLKIAYTDNGKGVQLPLKKGVGLSNTETRINNSDGTFSFDSEPDKGVKISCSFPI